MRRAPVFSEELHTNNDGIESASVGAGAFPRAERLLPEPTCSYPALRQPLPVKGGERGEQAPTFASKAAGKRFENQRVKKQAHGLVEPGPATARASTTATDVATASLKRARRADGAGAPQRCGSVNFSHR